MKVRWLCCLMPLFVLFVAETPAQGGGQGGGFGTQRATVQEALRFRDDTPVLLQGRIIRHIREEYYMFSDGSAEIRLEIEHWVWRGLTVGPDDLVEITGEIDRFLFFRPSVEVRSIRML